MPSGKYIRKPATAETSTTTTTPTTTKRRSRKRARSSSSGNRVVSTGGGAAAQMVMAPFLYDDAQLMTYQALDRNSDVSRIALQRFKDSIRDSLPNKGVGWTETERGFNPPKARTH